MPLTFCSCVCAGRQVVMELDLRRPGFYICSGCGAPEEIVRRTMELMQEQWTKTGIGAGHIPEQLMGAYLLESKPGEGPRITPFAEPWIESKQHSGRSLAELERKGQELTNA